MSNALGWVAVPVVPVFSGIAKKMSEGLVKPAEDAGKKAAKAVDKSTSDMVDSLSRQAAASAKKLEDLDAACTTSTKKRESQQKKLNAAIAEQTAAEEKYQAALKKGSSGTAELAKVERAKAKVVDETIKMTAAERDVVKAEENHAKQLKDLTDTTDKYEKAQAAANKEAEKSKGLFSGIGDAMGGLKDKAAEVGGPLGGVVDTLSSFKGATVVGALAAAGTAFGKFSDDLAQAQVDMQNSMGMTVDEARGMQGEIADAMSSGLGGYDETAQAVMAVHQSIGDDLKHMAGQSAADLSDNFMIFAQTFETSVEEAASRVDIMLNSGLVSSAEEGLDLLAKTMQGVSKELHPEIMDATEEYSKYFAGMGLSGAEAMQMLAMGAEQGQYGIDKIGDSIKEFQIRGQDLSKTSVDAYEALGLSADEMSRKVATGGEEANEALSLTAEKLLEIEDPAERANTAIALFGTPLEDVGFEQIPAFLEALSSGGEGMDDFAGTTQEMADNTSRTLSGWWAGVKGSLHGWAIDATNWANVTGGNIIGGIGGAINSSESINTLKGAFEELKVAFNGGDWGYGSLESMFGGDVAKQAVDMVASIKPAFGELKTAFSGGDDGYGGLEALFGGDVAKQAVDLAASVKPAFGEIRAAFLGGDDGFGGLETMFGSDAGKKIADFAFDIGEKFRGIKDSALEMWEAVQPFLEKFGEYLGENMSESLGSLWEALKNIGGTLTDLAGGIGGALLDMLKGLWEMVSPLLIPALKILGGIIGGALVVGISLLSEAFKFVANTIEFVTEKFGWFINFAIVPLIEWIGTIAGKFGEFVGAILSGVWPAIKALGEGIVNILVGAWNILGDALQFVWENVIKPVFDGLVTVGQWAIAIILTAVITPLQLAWEGLSAAFSWAWENVLSPILTWIGEKFIWLWESAVSPILSWIGEKWQAFQDLLHAGWLWINVNVFVPIRHGINSVATWFFEKIEQIRGIWQTLKDLLHAGWIWVNQNVFAPIRHGINGVATWFFEKIEQIRGIWDQLKSLLRAGYDWIDANVFDKIRSSLDTVRGWFETGVNTIGDLWSGLKKLLAEPINFVIRVVYNDGIKKVFDGVADKVGLDARLPTIKEIGGFASGGILPGYTPGRDPYEFIEPRTGMRIGLSGGEAILRPEATRALGKDWVDRVNAAARSGGVHAVQNRLKQSHFASGGVVDLGNFAGGGFINLAGSLNAIQRSHADFVSRHFPDLFALTSATRFTDSGYHSRGMATDWQAQDGQFASQQPTPASKGLARALFSIGKSLAELIHWPLDGWGNIKHGAVIDYGQPTNAQHANHVHLATTGILDGTGALAEAPEGAGGFSFNPLDWFSGFADKILDKLPKFDLDGFGDWAKVPGAALKTLASQVKDWALGKLKEWGEKFMNFMGIDGGGAQQWADLALDALQRMGYGPEHLSAMLQQIDIESGGNPKAVNDWDINAINGVPSGGLLQVIEPTYRDVRRRWPEAFEGLPDDRFHPLTNLTAGVGAVKRDWGGPAGRWPTRGGYADGGILPGFTPGKDIHDFWSPTAGWLHLSGGEAIMRPEFTQAIGPDGVDTINSAAASGSSESLAFALGGIFPGGNIPGAGFGGMAFPGMGSFSNVRSFDDLAKAIYKQFKPHMEEFDKMMDYESVEGINARAGLRRTLDLGLDLPGADVVSAILDGEEAIWSSRERHLGTLDDIREKEEALEAARKKVQELESSKDGLSKEEQRKLDDAKKNLEEAKAEADKAGSKAKDEKARAKAAEKVADAEEKLRRVREDIDDKSAENAEKRADEITKANEDVVKAENELAAVRKKQVQDLDNLVFVSQGQIESLIPQAADLAAKFVGMGGHAGLASQGLGAVVSGLTKMAGIAGPAGITVGMAFDAAKAVISIVKSVFDFVKSIIEKFRKARLDSIRALADGYGVIAEYSQLVTDMRHEVSTLRQALVRNLIDQRAAEVALRVAQHDRMIAEIEGALAVAEARLNLDKEIEKGAIAAQIKLMGLHEDWDSYLGYQALVAQGTLDMWSDVAISALFKYEAARAQALKGELEARVAQIQAEYNLAEINRQYARNQLDLLKAQERLIRMSADVAGIDLEDALGAQSLAEIMVEMAEAQAKANSNVFGKIGAFFGARGSVSSEYLGQKAQVDALEKSLRDVMKETQITIDERDLNRALNKMASAARRGADPMDVLRHELPELVAAEAALRTKKALDPVYAARDERDSLNRAVADFAAEIDLFEKTQPLEETIKALDYTVMGLEHASSAWGEGNEGLRGDYIAAAEAHREAAEALGVYWKMDPEYANDSVKDQIVKEVNVHLDGTKMYTADQIDELLEEVTKGTNARYTTTITSTELARARRNGGL